jgi:diacylglycerol kinase family enzyme
MAVTSPEVAALSKREQAKRMLVIVNPKATAMKERLRHLVVYALQGRYDVHVEETQHRGHALDLSRDAAAQGFDVVAVYAGDGTVNEAANGLAGTETALTALPGGSNNVWAKELGIPNDVVDATEHLLGLADRFEPRKIDLGIANGRRFVFSCGSGLDASAAMNVDLRPKLKAKAGPYFYTYVAVSAFYRQYLRNPIRMKFETGGSSAEGITVLAQNSDPFTYFGNRPVRVCEGIEIDDGTLSVAVLR